MTLAQIIVALTVFGFVSFTFVIFFGAPFLPTLKEKIDPALDLLELKRGQTMIELGSGDGRVMLEAARRGWIVIGYELNPILVIISKFRLRKYKSVSKVYWGNFWHKKWPQADGIFTFLLLPYMNKLNNKIIHDISGPVKLVSFAFQMTDKKPSKTNNSLYLYTYNNKKSKGRSPKS